MAKKKTYYETTKKYSLDQDGNLLLGDKIVQKAKKPKSLWVSSFQKKVIYNLNLMVPKDQAEAIATNWFSSSPYVSKSKMYVAVEDQWVYIGHNYFGGPPQDYENYQPMTWQQQDAALAAKSGAHGRLPETDKLPALDYKVRHPALNHECLCGDHDCPFNIPEWPLEKVIISLNDTYKWTREQIADWLEEISDPTGKTGPDIRFHTNKGESNE